MKFLCKFQNQNSSAVASLKETESGFFFFFFRISFPESTVFGSGIWFDCQGIHRIYLETFWRSSQDPSPTTFVRILTRNHLHGIMESKFKNWNVPKFETGDWKDTQVCPALRGSPSPLFPPRITSWTKELRERLFPPKKLVSHFTRPSKCFQRGSMFVKKFSSISTKFEPPNFLPPLIINSRMWRVIEFHKRKPLASRRHETNYKSFARSDDEGERNRGDPKEEIACGFGSSRGLLAVLFPLVLELLNYFIYNFLGGPNWVVSEL